MNRNEEFEEKVYQTAFPYLIRYFQSLNRPHSKLLSLIDDSKLNQIGNRIFLVKHNHPGREFNLQYGGLLISGSLTIFSSHGKFLVEEDYHLLLPLEADEGFFKTKLPCKILAFSDLVVFRDQYANVRVFNNDDENSLGPVEGKGKAALQDMLHDEKNVSFISLVKL